MFPKGVASRLDRPQIPEVVVSGGVAVLLALLTALVIRKGGAAAAVALMGLPVGLALLVVIFIRPKVGLLASVHLSFAVLAMGRYLPTELPFGLAVDFVLVVTAVAALFKIRRGDWNALPLGLCAVLTVWGMITVLELFNPEAPGLEAWIYAIRSTAFQMGLTILLSLLLFKDARDIEQMLFIWMLWSVGTALWGMKQLHIGLNDSDRAWLAAGAAKTHVLNGKLRAFSVLTDAGTFGVCQAHACLLAGILAVHAAGLRKRLLYGLIAGVCFYGMAISGTRGALFVLLAGGAAYLLLSGNVKVLLTGAMLGLLFIGFLKFSTIGQGNYQVRRMRSALNPQDASFQVRLYNQRRLSEYLASRPFGGGVGSVGFWGRRFNAGSFLGHMPTDSWYVRIWAETGWIGLTYYLAMMGYVLIAGFGKVFRMRDGPLRVGLTAFYAGIAGLAVASYGNELWGSYPIAPLVYISVAFVFNAHLLKETQPDPQPSTTDT